MLSGKDAEKYIDSQCGVKGYRYPFTPYPDGWYAVAWEEDINPKKGLPGKICGKDVVVFKTESGNVNVFDAYCPHLGAHLGYGGVVEGNSIVCPFHNWSFGESGACDGVRCVDKPIKASVKKWRSVVVDGMVMAWYSAGHEEPLWQVDSYWDEGWTKPALTDSCQWVLRVHVQDICENGIDTAHFAAVHGTEDFADKLEVNYHKHKAYWSTTGEHKVENEIVRTESDTVLQGLGLLSLLLKDPAAGISIRTYLHMTPIDDEHVAVRMPVAIESSKSESIDSEMFNAIVHELAQVIEKDFDIWENKQYIERPPYSRIDGPIGKFRDWAKRFYTQE
jgi:3-ketosteroid 9alpha-monooxygenase subunit A